MNEWTIIIPTRNRGGMLSACLEVLRPESRTKLAGFFSMLLGTDHQSANDTAVRPSSPIANELYSICEK
jgi:hypothetical protein